MTKICDKSLLEPLVLLFQSSNKYLAIQICGKQFHVIIAHKKSGKQLVKNYQTISLLPIFGKIFEKIIFNRMYNFLLDERLLNPNQSDFRPSDTCVNQLLAITHDIFDVFDFNPTLEVRCVFLDISKATD